jgi:hypothetical protein
VRRLAALIFALIAGLLAWLIPIASAEAASGQPPTPIHTYNATDHSEPSTLATTERGPPATYDQHTTYDAVDRLSHGHSARPVGAMSSATHTYGHPVLPVQVASGTSMTLGRAGATAGLPPPLEPSHVAANIGRTTARTCLRSLAGTTLVLMADGAKKPIEDIKVGDKVVATDPETGERESPVSLRSAGLGLAGRVGVRSPGTRCDS